MSRVLCGLLLAGFVAAQAPGRPGFFLPATLYAVASAHLDSQWHWSYPATISKYLPRTLKMNFNLFRKYPRYIFNFGGAKRYRMMEEYYPHAFAALKRHVAAGRWFPSGSSMEECDVNIAAPESIIRQILYGGRYFRGEFGRNSEEFMLPDGFGFPASLPTVLAHCGIRGFSTQKLYRGSSAPAGGPGSPQRTPEGIPFNVGYWQGVDGRGVIAALNPGKYNGEIWYDLSRSPESSGLPRALLPQAVDWPERILRNGKVSGLFADYMYYGTGDRGGAPSEASVRLLEAIINKGAVELPPPPRPLRLHHSAKGERVRVGDGPLRVLSATAEQMFKDIGPRQAARLPRYRGEFQLTNHSCGTLTSQAYIKRWNRRGEVMADAAERAAVAAEWLAGWPYPRQRLNEAWSLLLGAQFHDILAGTCKPEAFEYSWNDQLLALNQFSSVLTGAGGAVAASLDTRVAGIPVVVFNALEIGREDMVEAAVRFAGGAPPAVRVFDPHGREVPAQMTGAGRVLFLARVPAAGFAVYDIRAGDSPANALPSTLKVNERSLENDRYRVLLDENGDVASIVDKKLLRELLASPAHLEIKTDEPAAFPAWNMEWGDQMRPPRLRLKQPLRVTIVERGPARVALAVDRRGEGSRFIQTIRLAAGAAGERLEFANAIDWRTGSAHLKAVFPLAAASGKATYNLDVGTIERPGNNPKMFEMASQRWFDQTDAGGSFGVTVLSDCKYGSDKPDDRTLRLTLLRTPGARGWHAEQATQDWGHHEFVYGLAAHAGDWRRAQTDWQAYRLNQPLLAWQATRHDGPLGRSFSFLRLSRERVRVLALKKAEAGAEIVIRLVEMNGQGVAGVRVGFAAPLLSARELDGQERPVGGARVRDGELVADFGPYQLRTFALTLAPAPGPLRAPRGVPIKLAHNVRVAGGDGERSCTGFDAQGRLFPAGMFPARIVYQGVGFELATAQDSLGQATACMGQEIILPPGRFAKLLVLAAADGEQQATFRVDDKAFELAIQDWGGFIGQWDNRIWQMAGDGSASGGGPVTSPGRGKPPDSAPRVTCIGLEPGFVKPAPVAWFATHRHDAAGTDDPYAYAYMFAYELDLAAPARVLRLPDNRRIRLFAVTAVDRNGTLRPLWPAGDGLAAGIP